MADPRAIAVHAATDESQIRIGSKLKIGDMCVMRSVNVQEKVLYGLANVTIRAG